MQNDDNSGKVYLKATKQWVPVTDEFHKDYYRRLNNFRQYQRRQGLCCCPRQKWWMCDEDCDICDYRKFADQSSLDEEVQTEEGEEVTLGDAISDPEADLEESFILMETMDALYRELERLDPESLRLCQLYMEGKSERECAEILKIPKTNYRRKWGQIKAELYEKLKVYF